MASSLIDVCRFNPTLGGTTDWTYSSAVTGYQSPTAAGAVNGATYSYRAESADLSQWEVGVGAYNSGTGVVARTTVLFNSAGTTAKINFTTAPQVAIVALAEDVLAFNVAQTLTTTQKKQAQSNLFVAPTTQSLTSGTAATYTTPTGCTWIEVFMVGGGGGGGGANSAATVAGSDGGTSTFNSVNALGGKGATLTSSYQTGGAGGSGGTGTATRRGRGGPGGGVVSASSSVATMSGQGGNSYFAGGAAGVPNNITGSGTAADANSGAGGSGAVNTAGALFELGAGGGAGEFVYLLIAAPAGSYTYTIGAGGAGGVTTTNGGAGGSGFAFVVEHYGS